MTDFGFHASHEQIDPRQLLLDVQRAEQAGFQMAMCSDHFAPWSERQGHSGFAWSWLGAALASTRLRFGCVNAPGQRYHPAIVAQAVATLGQMFPDRFWVALGSGEAMNEHITGERWPRKEVRTQRLEECAQVIRSLLTGQEVSHDGLVTVDRARLWDLPPEPPSLRAAAISIETARRAASWGEGLITLNQPTDHLRRMIEVWREAGGSGPLALQVHLSWAPTEDEAMAIAHDQWRSNVFGDPVTANTELTQAFDMMSAEVSEQTVRGAVRVSADLGQHAAWLAEYAAMGFDEIYLHHVGQDQAGFIDSFGERVLPQVREL